MEGKTLSHFRILEKLGEGGMGIVYRAEDTSLRRHVALKLLRPGFVEDEERRVRFKREARAAAAISHPNIATIHEIDDADGTTFIAMELIEGESLRHRLTARGALPIPEAVRIAGDVASALAKAHGAGVIHRDLKPDNVMITSDGHVKILDFGLAKLLDPAAAPTSEDELEAMETMPQHLTREGRVFGTAAYMSPEQARGHVVDTRSDLFSFGVMLYEMVTGKLPFSGETISDTISSVLRDSVVPAIELNPATPPELDRILSRLLQKKADERYQSSRDLMLELRQLGRSTDSASYPTELTPPSGSHAAQASSGGMGSGSSPSYGHSHATGAPTSGSGPHAAPARRGPWQMVLVGGLAIVAIVVIGVLASVVRPLLAGREDRQVAQPAAQAEPGALAIHALENLKDPEDPERLGQILQELIITDLSSVKPLRVFSSQRLYDIQKMFTGRDRRVYDRETATEVAEYAGAEMMLTGSISQLGERWILVSQLVDVKSGTITASERIDGTDLYAMVDQLTERIRGRLDLTAAAGGALDKNVREMTTSSIEAYRQYIRGMELLNQQAFDEAVAVLDSAVTLDPDFTRAYYPLALAHWWAQDGAEAAREPLQEILSGDLDVSDKERGMAEGTYLLVNSEYEDALPTFERLADEYPDEKDVWYMLGECLYHKRDPDRMRSLRAFVRSVKLDPEFYLGYSHIFDIYNANAMFDEALALSRVLVDLDPSPEHYGLWIEYTAIASDDAALDAALAEAQTRHPEEIGRGDLMLGVGNAHLRMGRFEEAWGAFEEAAASEEADVSLAGELGKARVESGRLDLAAAERRYRELLADPEGGVRPSVFRRLAEMYLQEGRYRDGLALVEQYPAGLEDAELAVIPEVAYRVLSPERLSDDQIATLAASLEPPVRAELYDLAARSAALIADAERADRFEAIADSLRPGINDDDYIRRASTALSLADVATAERIISEALVLNPGNAELLLVAAEAALFRGAPAEAVEYAQRAVTFAPYGKRSRRMLIRSLLADDRWPEADAALDAARTDLPPELFAWVLVGSRLSLSRGVAFAYARAGDAERASELVAEAARTWPEHPDVAHARGWLALGAGETAAAADAFRRGLERSRPASFDSARMQVGLTIARLVSGDLEGATATLRPLLDEAPRTASSERLAAHVLTAAGRTDEALAHARRALDMDPGAESRAALAWVLVESGRDVARGAELAAEAEGAPESWEHPLVPSCVAPPEHTLGLAALREGRLAEAVQRLEAAAAAFPDRPLVGEHLEEARTALREAQG